LGVKIRISGSPLVPKGTPYNYAYLKYGVRFDPFLADQVG